MINNHLRMVRTILKYANDIEATEREIRYRLGLKSVPKPVVRKHEATLAAKEYTADEVWKLLESADVQMRAFVLLGVNCGYGPMDIARLRIDQIDFEGQWLGAVRGKTGVARGCWLWPETLSALRAAIDAKPMTRREENIPLAFLTRNRRPWGADGESSNPLAQAFAKVKDAAGIDKHGVGHYALRHTFATVASGAKDPEATDFVMGHLDGSMAGNYREGIDPERVKAVCQHVRDWFLAAKPDDGGEA